MLNSLPHAQVKVSSQTIKTDTETIGQYHLMRDTNSGQRRWTISSRIGLQRMSWSCDQPSEQLHRISLCGYPLH